MPILSLLNSINIILGILVLKKHDATTGEIIGGSRWNGAKRQISQLIEDPHNLIEK